MIDNDYDIIKEKYGIKSFRFELDIAPCPAPRMTQRDKWAKRPIVMRYFGFKNEVRSHSKLIGYELENVLNIVFVVTMPESWSKKKKNEMLYQLHTQRPDRDNYLKAFQDSFNGDDGLVADGRTLKIWGLKPAIIIF